MSKFVPEFPAKRIWSRAPHNAFTDLAWFQGAWWCAFRESEGHMVRDGKVRVLRSTNGVNWRTSGFFELSGDLRDPKLVVTPQNTLVLLVAMWVPRKEHGYSHQVFAWVHEHRSMWSEARPVGERDQWLWRVAFNDRQQGLAVSYKTGGDPHSKLYSTEDALTFEARVDRMRGEAVAEYSNEAGLCFDHQGVAHCLLRRDPEVAVLGRAKPPYTRWRWQESNVRIGGPVMRCLPDGRLLAVVRLYGYTDGEISSARTSFVWVNPKTGKIKECGRLVSAGDTSYAGLVIKDDIAYVSYYSSHGPRCAIYFAHVPLAELG